MRECSAGETYLSAFSSPCGVFVCHSEHLMRTKPVFSLPQVSHYFALTPVMGTGFDTPAPFIVGLRTGSKIIHLLPSVSRQPHIDCDRDTRVPGSTRIVFGSVFNIMRRVPQPVFEYFFGRQAFAYTNQSFLAFADAAMCTVNPAICSAIKDMMFHRDLTTLLLTDSHLNKVCTFFIRETMNLLRLSTHSRK